MSKQPSPFAPVVRRGLPRWSLSDLYHDALRASWSGLLAGIFALYLLANLIFACVYYLSGDVIEGARPGSFVDAFFFSVHTFATIGYGTMSPKGLHGNILVTIESFTGLSSIALVTGLLFTKFSRPSSRVVFSTRMVVETRNGVPTLMFRVANERASTIAEAACRVTLLRSERTAEGSQLRRLIDLPLVRTSTPILALTWTVMSEIVEGHPLFGLGPEELSKNEIEFIVTVTGMDDGVSQVVHARYRYTAADVLFGHRFADTFDSLPDGTRVFDFARFHDTEPSVPA